MGRILKAHQRRDHARHELSLTKIPQDLLMVRAAGIHQWQSVPAWRGVQDHKSCALRIGSSY